VKIFCAVANNNWELPNLIQPLKDMGHEIVLYDWKAKGYDQYSESWTTKKKQMNDELLGLVKKSQKLRKFDLFFGYLSDPVIEPEYITEISLLMPTLNFSCNDIFTFDRGHKLTSSKFDLNWTTNKAAVKNYESVGAKVFVTPHGINPKAYTLTTKTIPNKMFDVSFVGQLYGYRIQLFNHLTQLNISYALYGRIPFQKMLQTYLETKVNLNFSGAPGANFYDLKNKQLRLRDFEIPAAGGLYLTERCDFVQELYEEDEEILFYSSPQEMVDKILFYSNDKNRIKAKMMAQAGQRRCLSEYTSEKIFNRVFKEMGLV